MKLTFLMMFIFCMQVSAKVYSQKDVKLSLNLEGVKLSKVLTTIEKKTDFRFLYNDREVLANKRLDVKVDNTPLTDILSRMLLNTGLNYKILENNLIIIAPENTLSQEITVKGKVTDSLGHALPGVTVKVEGANRGTTTDANGEYSITVPDKGELIFSFIGYITQNVVINGEKEINVVLKGNATGLNEVVVVAYGTTVKKDLTTAVSTVNVNKVSSIASPSINDELGGRIPGVFITANGGGPGVKDQIYIRGNVVPLFIIDGFIRSQNDYENLNPSDIESYSVLKDAEATAMYGAEGGNGVVVVTTKQGKEGPPQFNYTFNQIWTQPTVLPRKLNSFDKASAIDKVYTAEGLTPPYADSVLAYYKNQAKPFVYPNTDWQQIAMRKFAPEERHDFSVSSGTKTLKYYGGLSYYHQGSILKTDNNYNDRITYRMNVENSLNQIGLKIQTGLDGFVEKNVVPNSSTANSYFGIFSHIQNKSPMNLAYNDFGLPYVGTTDNPAVELSGLSGYGRSISRVFNSILSFDWEPNFAKGLHLKASGNYNMWNSMDKGWNVTAPSYALGSTTPIYGNPPRLTETNGDGSTIVLQGFVTYNRSLGKNHIGFTGGYEQTQGMNSSLTGQRVNYQILFDQFVAGPTVNMYVNGSESKNANAGYVGRLQYNWDSKYFLEASMRYDGSYLFPPSKRWGLFYGFSGGWIMTEEKFLHFLVDNKILSYLKLRGSYGLVGTTANVPAYSYLSAYNINANTWLAGGQPQPGLSEGSLPSTSYSWYSNASSDVGVDFATLGNHLTGSFDYFYVRTTGYVIPDTSYAITLGKSLPVINSNAALRKAGFEFNVIWKDHIEGLHYSVGVNFSRYNQLWELYPGENFVDMENPYTRTSGTDNSYYTTGYNVLGYYQTNTAVLNGPHRPTSINMAAGDLQYEDTNGDGKIDGSDFRRIGSSTFPHVNYGVMLDMDYKGVYLDAVVMGSGNRDMYMGDVIQGSSAQGILVYGFQTNYWTAANPYAPYPRQLSSTGFNGGNNVSSSDFWLLHSSFIRLKSLQVGYDLKSTAFMKRIPFSQFKIFLTGRNLFTIANSLKYYIDPESDPNNYNYSVQRTFAIGCSVGF